MKKIMLVFGTRPEAIKMAPLVLELKKHKDKFECVVCVTAQHRQMLDSVMEIFDLKADYDLNIMKQGQDLYDITSAVLVGMRDVIKKVEPDIILVHGDTSTSTAAALAGFYAQKKVAHVEAGLRTNNIYSPFPEEVNRQITGRIAKYHFAPTELSKQNLVKENIDEKNIYITGNTVIDALFWVNEKIKSDSSLQKNIDEQILSFGYDVNRKKDIVLITGHRRENFGEGFLNICRALKKLSETHSEVDFVYPMHLNPNVRKPITDVFGEDKKDNLFFIEPLDYLPFVRMMSLSTLILTDSGGVQEEAPSLGKPVLVMRDTTERPEAVEASTVRLVGTDKDKIVSDVSELLKKGELYSQMRKSHNPYGDGLASKRIVEILENI